MRDVLRRLLMVACLWLAGTALGAEIDIANPQLMPGEDGYTLSANLGIELNPRLEEAVAKGVVLHFVAEFALSRPRSYWFDEKLVSRLQTYRLSYHALTRQYRLSSGGGLHQSFTSLSEALAMLSRLRGWTVLERSDPGLRAGDSYQAALRFYLDISQLPRPFQISALGNRDWSLNSDWKSWAVVLPALPAGEAAK